MKICDEIFVLLISSVRRLYGDSTFILIESIMHIDIYYDKITEIGRYPLASTTFNIGPTLPREWRAAGSG